MSDYQQLVVDTFLGPIKNVLVIDDEFPCYDSITQKKARKALDTGRARGIFNFFQRKHGLVCSFENKFPNELDNPISKTLGNSDLLIIDYHLNGGDDSALALKIIEKVTQSPKFNLIIVYTADANEDPTKTIFEILVHLCRIDKMEDKDEIKDFVYKEDRYREILRSVTFEHAIEFICGENVKLKELSKKASEIIPPDKKRTIKANDIVTYALYDKFSVMKHATGTHEKITASVGNYSYIKGNNFFITVAGKKCVQPNKLLGHLKKSLIRWNPEPVLLTLQRLLNELRNNAPKHINAVLKDEDMVNGWLFHAKKDNSSPANMKRLADSLMTELSASVTEQYFNTNKEHLNKKAIDPDIKTIHALNQYLCTYSAILSSHLTTGVVLFSEAKSEYWLVLNCSCDLVPGQKFPWKENTTKPWQPFTAVKLISSKCSKKHFISADRGECIFIKHGEDRIALQFRNDNNHNPHYEVFYAADEGRFTGDNKIMAHRFIVKKIKDESTNTEKPDPVLEPVEFNVIAQLRYEYACRFLQMLVSNKGRIGVDFVSLPK